MDKDELIEFVDEEGLPILDAEKLKTKKLRKVVIANYFEDEEEILPTRKNKKGSKR